MDAEAKTKTGVVAEERRRKRRENEGGRENLGERALITTECTKHTL